jgi:hypothetical protein
VSLLGTDSLVPDGFHRIEAGRQEGGVEAGGEFATASSVSSGGSKAVLPDPSAGTPPWRTHGEEVIIGEDKELRHRDGPD